MYFIRSVSEFAWRYWRKSQITSNKLVCISNPVRIWHLSVANQMFFFLQFSCRKILRTDTSWHIFWGVFFNEILKLYGPSIILQCICSPTDTQIHRSGHKQLTVRESPLIKPAHAAWMLLQMDPWGPERCRADWFVNKLCYIRVQFFLQHRSGRKQLTVRESPLTKPAHAAWTLLKMDPCGPKHCRADWFVNKLCYIRVLCICWTVYTLMKSLRFISKTP
jgi:hypothetical protein